MDCKKVFSPALGMIHADYESNDKKVKQEAVDLHKSTISIEDKSVKIEFNKKTRILMDIAVKKFFKHISLSPSMLKKIPTAILEKLINDRMLGLDNEDAVIQANYKGEYIRTIVPFERKTLTKSQILSKLLTTFPDKDWFLTDFVGNYDTAINMTFLNHKLCKIGGESCWIGYNIWVSDLCEADNDIEIYPIIVLNQDGNPAVIDIRKKVVFEGIDEAFLDVKLKECTFWEPQLNVLDADVMQIVKGEQIQIKDFILKRKGVSKKMLPNLETLLATPSFTLWDIASTIAETSVDLPFKGKHKTRLIAGEFLNIYG
jgi:hypothetical protein